MYWGKKNVELKKKICLADVGVVTAGVVGNETQIEEMRIRKRDMNKRERGRQRKRESVWTNLYKIVPYASLFVFLRNVPYMTRTKSKGNGSFRSLSPSSGALLSW